MSAAAELDKPLRGVRVVEFEGLGPGPLAGMILADFGAEVTTLVRPAKSAAADPLAGIPVNPLHRGKRIEAVDLKTAEGRDRALALVAQADALIEGNRPGVMERLGLGPETCAACNPKLVYGRMTGWGQSGPMAPLAGHDLNYVALTGVLSLASRQGQPPVLPPTMVGDAPGALGLAFGITTALLAVRAGGPGRVVDAAIVDIVAMLGSLLLGVRAAGQVDGQQPSLFHDSPFYDTYACADGGFITLGAIEPQFYAQALARLGLDDLDPRAQYDRAAWPATKARLTALFQSQPRAHWCALLEDSDACFASVLRLAEAAAHPHNQARGTYAIDERGIITAAPAPRFLPLTP